MYTLQFDGMVHQIDESVQNKGLLGYGWLILRGGMEIARGYGLFAHGRLSNSNIAEYLALIEGLEALADLRVWNNPIEIRGDAKCVIDQMRGASSVSATSTLSFYQRAQNLSGRFRALTWRWVPRKENKLADKLSRRSLKQLFNLPWAYQQAIYKANTCPLHAEPVSLMDLRCIYNARGQELH